MARRLGLDPMTLRRWEPGKGRPRKGHLERLDTFLNSTEFGTSQDEVKVDRSESDL